MKKSAYYPFFKKLANPLRIAIVVALAKKDMSVSELCQELHVEQSKISHALHELAGCFIVTAKKQGKERIYKLNKTIVPLFRLIDKHSKKFCKFCVYKRE